MEEGVWLGSSSEDVMSMDPVTTPPPNEWDQHFDGSSSMFKAKSAKSEREHAYVDNNWLNPSTGTGSGLVSHITVSKSSKSHEMVAVVVPSTDQEKSEIISTKASKAMHNVSKSSKTYQVMSIGHEIIHENNGIKVTSKTGKGSYNLSDGQVIMVSKSSKQSIPKSAKAYHVMSISDEIMHLNNGIKVTSKTGKGSYHLSDGQVIMVSKSSKQSIPMSYSQQDDTTSGVKMTSKTGKSSHTKSTKAYHVMSISDEIIHVNNGIKVTSKTGKGSYHLSDEQVQVVVGSSYAKSAKGHLLMSIGNSHYDSDTGLSKSGKSDHSEIMRVSKSAKSNQMSYSQYVENGRVKMTKTSKAKSSKSAVDNIEMSIGHYSKSAKGAYVNMSIKSSHMAAKSSKSEIEVVTNAGKSAQHVNMSMNPHPISTKSAKSDIEVVAKAGKNTQHINMSMNPYPISTKSAKSAAENMSMNSSHIAAKSAKSETNVMTKSGKSVHFMSIGDGEHDMLASSKGSKSVTHTSTKSSKSYVDSDIIQEDISPEEAGLPFRSKSSKTLPIRYIHGRE